MKREQVLQSARLAGQLRRYHSWPMHHTQSVGEHSWQCMRIYYQIWGQPTAEIYEYFLWHDVGELATGDLPFPVKSKDKVLKEKMDSMECEAVSAMGGPDLRQLKLSPDVCVRVKACDLIEMHEAGTFEMQMGNRFAVPIVEDTMAAVTALPLTQYDREKVWAYLEKVRYRGQAKPYPHRMENLCT